MDATAENNAEPGPSTELFEADQPLSKNAIKRAKKAERYAASKLERRAKEKEKKKLRKAEEKKRAAVEEVDEEGQERGRKRAKVESPRKVEFGGRVVVDLGFDEMMSDKVCNEYCIVKVSQVSVIRRSYHSPPSSHTPIALIDELAIHFPSFSHL